MAKTNIGFFLLINFIFYTFFINASAMNPSEDILSKVVSGKTNIGLPKNHQLDGDQHLLKPDGYQLHNTNVLLLPISRTQTNDGNTKSSLQHQKTGQNVSNQQSVYFSSIQQQLTATKPSQQTFPSEGRIDKQIIDPSGEIERASEHIIDPSGEIERASEHIIDPSGEIKFDTRSETYESSDSGYIL